MGFPRTGKAGACWLTLALTLATGLPALGAVLGRAPGPVTRIELEPMGYEGLQMNELLAGSPMLTVDFVDDKHLLVTFEVRRLMKREADALPGERDRTVAACLVEIATGNVLARTEWRLHDRSQYLWNLGQGRFLLRIHDELSAFAPMQHRPEDAFRASPFLVTNRRLIAVMLSAERDLLTVESVKAEATTGDNVTPDPSPVQVNFYRIRDDAAGKLVAVSAGTIRSRTPVALPLTTAGYLDILEGGKRTWYFNFDEHAGKVTELLAFDTSCFPRPRFVSNSEFVVFGCKNEDRRIFAGFNLQKEQMWQQGLYEPYIAPTFSFAPASGRFALGRVLVTEPMAEDATPNSSFVTGQDVRVYQMHSGRQLFRIDCTPVERAGGNYALSPDGLELAVIREADVRRKGDSNSTMSTSQAAIEIYALPPLSPQDSTDVKTARSAAPPDTDARIDEALVRLAKSRHLQSGKAVTANIQAVPEPTPSAIPPAAAGQSTNPADGAQDDPAKATVADPAKGVPAALGSGAPPTGVDPAAARAQPEEPRKPPTLYGPGEQPERK